MAKGYDAIVLGVGGMGSAALYELARRGLRVCGVERFGVAHERGSSHGQTRIIRKAYFEHVGYAPLLERSYQLWAQLEAASGQKLFAPCGFLTAGAPDSETIRGLEAYYRANVVPHERLGRDAAAERFPQLRLAAGAVVFLDAFGGYLLVEECVRRHVELARRHGAELCLGEPARSWSADAFGVRVRTERQELHADRLVVTAGAWAARLLGSLGVPLEVWRKVIFWYRSDGLDELREDRFPTFYVESARGHFYGFPALEPWGMKVAEHMQVTPVGDADEIDREVHDADEAPVLAFLAEAFPSLQPRRTRAAVCMYTISPDHQFIVDRHPGHENVVVAAGFSGHGFKFSPVIGEVLADLVIEGRTRHPIEFLSATRFE